MNTFAPGQRWFSSAEPELGLGTVLRLAGRQVQIVFTGTGVVRLYALGSAPLLRAVFRPGERIRVGGQDKTVEHAELLDGAASTTPAAAACTPRASWTPNSRCRRPIRACSRAAWTATTSSSSAASACSAAPTPGRMPAGACSARAST